MVKDKLTQTTVYEIQNLKKMKISHQTISRQKDDIDTQPYITFKKLNENKSNEVCDSHDAGCQRAVQQSLGCWGTAATHGRRARWQCQRHQLPVH